MAHARWFPSAAFATFAAAFLAPPTVAMEYGPFPPCTESVQIDSVAAVQHYDPIMDTALAPYHSYFKYQFLPSTCLLSRAEGTHYFLQGSLLVQRTYSADRRQAEQTFQFPIGTTVQRGTVWLSSQGLEDSSHTLEFFSGGTTQTEETFIRRRRTSAYETYKEWSRGDGGTYELIYADSVAFNASGFTVHTSAEDENTINTCTRTANALTCIPRENGINEVEMEKKVWHLTAGRVDSLRTYNMSDRLLSVEYWFWKPRSASIFAKDRPARGARFHHALPGAEPFDLLGRRVKSLPGPARYPR